MASKRTNNSTSTSQSTMTAEERGRKKASIRASISASNIKLEKVNTQIISLTTEYTNLNTYLGNWETQKSLYNGNNILSEVVIINIFEGVCADKIKEKIEGCISCMDQTYSNTTRLRNSVDAQIQRLEQQVLNIGTKITSLNNQLNAL